MIRTDSLAKSEIDVPHTKIMSLMWTQNNTKEPLLGNSLAHLQPPHPVQSRTRPFGSETSEKNEAYFEQLSRLSITNNTLRVNCFLVGGSISLARIRRWKSRWRKSHMEVRQGRAEVSLAAFPVLLNCVFKNRTNKWWRVRILKKKRQPTCGIFSNHQHVQMRFSNTLSLDGPPDLALHQLWMLYSIHALSILFRSSPLLRSGAPPKYWYSQTNALILTDNG